MNNDIHQCLLLQGWSQLSLFAGELIIYTENPNESTNKFLKLISDYSKDAEYKINIQMSVAFLYTTNAQVEFEIKSTILFTLALKEMKCLSITQTKFIKDLFEENSKTLVNEITE